jgi:hypothetical protein
MPNVPVSAVASHKKNGLFKSRATGSVWSISQVRMLVAIPAKDAQNLPLVG